MPIIKIYGMSVEHGIIVSQKRALADRIAKGMESLFGVEGAGIVAVSSFCEACDGSLSRERYRHLEVLYSTKQQKDKIMEFFKESGITKELDIVFIKLAPGGYVACEEDG